MPEFFNKNIKCDGQNSYIDMEIYVYGFNILCQFSVV